MHRKHFLAFLDQFKDRDLNTKDFHRLLQGIDIDYEINVSKKIFFDDRTSIFPDENTNLPVWKVNTNYWKELNEGNNNLENWVAKHEVEIEFSPIENILIPASVPLIINNVKINVSEYSKTLSGLIEIIDAYKYDENTVYNIDLKALHNIREELVELNGMIGMKDLKDQILDQLLYFIQNLHINKDSDYKHTIIYGSPGVGKSCVCKLIGMMYSKIGILKNNTFKKVTRSDLVAGYLGQTVIKTNKVIEECLGGVLFIDEVYSLGSKNSDGGADIYSKECIDTLCEALSFHRDDLMVIVAGYREEIEECFFSVNKGLSSRFIWRFMINGYDSKELMSIFMQKIYENEWRLSEDLKNSMEEWFKCKENEFKNYGRDMELLFSYTKICHSRRIFGNSVDEVKIITRNDLDNGYKVLKKNRREHKGVPYGIYI